MSSIDTYLNSLNFSEELTIVKNLLDSAQAKVTFWGSRVVSVDSFTGSVYLDDLAAKVVRAGQLRSSAGDLSLEEQIIGKEIVKKLGYFYNITYDQIQNSNFFTRFLNWIQEFSCTVYYPKLAIQEEAEGLYKIFK